MYSSWSGCGRLVAPTGAWKTDGRRGALPSARDGGEELVEREKQNIGEEGNRNDKFIYCEIKVDGRNQGLRKKLMGVTNTKQNSAR